MRTVNQTPPPAAVVMLLIYRDRGGAALSWAVAGTWDWLWRFDVTDHVWTRDPGAWQLGSLADN